MIALSRSRVRSGINRSDREWVAPLPHKANLFIRDFAPLKGGSFRYFSLGCPPEGGETLHSRELFENNKIISSFGGAKTRKKVEFFPPLGGIKRGYPEEQDRTKMVLFRDQSPAAALRHLPLRGRKNSSKSKINPPLGGLGGKNRGIECITRGAGGQKRHEIGSWGQKRHEVGSWGQKRQEHGGLVAKKPGSCGLEAKKTAKKNFVPLTNDY